MEMPKLSKLPSWICPAAGTSTIVQEARHAFSSRE
jgi:hypothetical protein